MGLIQLAVNFKIDLLSNELITEFCSFAVKYQFFDFQNLRSTPLHYAGVICKYAFFYFSFINFFFCISITENFDYFFQLEQNFFNFTDKEIINLARYDTTFYFDNPRKTPSPKLPLFDIFNDLFQPEEVVFNLNQKLYKLSSVYDLSVSPFIELYTYEYNSARLELGSFHFFKIK